MIIIQPKALLLLLFLFFLNKALTNIQLSLNLLILPLLLLVLLRLQLLLIIITTTTLCLIVASKRKQGFFTWCISVRISDTIECKMQNNCTIHVPTICSRGGTDGLLIATTNKNLHVLSWLIRCVYIYMAIQVFFIIFLDMCKYFFSTFFLNYCDYIP